MTGKAYPSDGTDMEVASVDQDQTGGAPQNDAKEAATELIVVKLPEAKKGSVLLPKHRLVERNFALTLRLRSLHFLAFASMMSQAFVKNNAHNL